jgi:16S rRNA processing protein RimM
MTTGDVALLEVGRIIKPHGIRGEVVVLLSTDRTERVAEGVVLQTKKGPLTIRRSRPHLGAHVVQFAEIADRNAAELWRNIVLQAEPLDVDDDVIWIHELFGAAVVTPDGRTRGTVVAVEENPASDLLVLDSGVLVPLVFVTSVVANDVIEVDPPEGLFE